MEENKYNETNFPDESFQESGRKEPNKVLDVFIGLGLGILLIILSSYFLFSNIVFPIFILLYIALIIFFFAKGRGKISLGLILTIIIPIAVVGGCLVFVSFP